MLVFFTTGDSRWAELVEQYRFAETEIKHVFTEEAVRELIQSEPDAVVIDAEACGGAPLEVAARLKDIEAKSYVPVLLVVGANEDLNKIPQENLPIDDCMVGIPSRTELFYRLRQALRVKNLWSDLNAKNSQLFMYFRELQGTFTRMGEELKLARRLQLSMFPPRDLEFPGSRFVSVNIPSGQVSGDFYDVFRLDETHVGFYVADAIGHGVPAAMLAVFVKRGIHTKEIKGHSYRIIPPGEVLGQLNQDIIDQNLSDSPFITMCYGVFNGVTGALRISSAGHPKPFIIRSGGRDIDLADTEGSLLGVFDEEFGTTELALREGDKVIFYSDGTENAGLLTGAKPGPEVFESALREFAHLPAGRFVEQVVDACFTEKLANLMPDDMTIVAMEVGSKIVPK